eukprot:TRINITY_DN55480_c0_g1_i1.p1 TRINITY_DN55480_c0_g1~~TRINITY_DN55480_c0_g1_i1.p1  ORF type:complete len:439 (+),score=68.36 TRINITY_DN55480_c0_g1_i1:117-1433(+)
MSLSAATSARAVPPLEAREADETEESSEARQLVLFCGLPGCGKDLIGRACARNFPRGAALSQDEHNGNAGRTHAAVESLLQKKRSPIFILRNGNDASDRSPYTEAARRHGYRVLAAWPAEMTGGDQQRQAALFLASVAGCYGRLSNEGQMGHETLTVCNDNWLRPAKVCLSFLQSFRAPSCPGEVDRVLCMPFLRMDIDTTFGEVGSVSDGADLDDGLLTCVAAQLRRGASVPDVVASRVGSGLQETQQRLAPFTTWRRKSSELIEEMTNWAQAFSEETRENSVASALPTQQPLGPPPAPSKLETRAMQRLTKIRGAVEHLVSPANIAGCRANGSTVTNCVWIPVAGSPTGFRPAWPASHFCGSPQLKRLSTTEEEVMAAARASASAPGALQPGADGARVELVADSNDSIDNHGVLVTPVDPLPQDSLLKLRVPISKP